MTEPSYRAASLRSIAVLFREVLRNSAAVRHGREGFIMLTLEPENISIALRVTRYGIEICRAEETRGQALFAMRGTLSGLKSFFGGGFDQAVENGEVWGEGSTEFLRLLTAA
jgi:hypothetical protein